MRVFISGPLSEGNQGDNVRRAMDLAITLIDTGHTPYCPHLTFFLDLLCARPYDVWIQQALSWLSVCDALVRLPGPSRGADREEDAAKEWHIPVYHGYLEFWRANP